MQKLKFRYVKYAHIFFIFFWSPSDDLSLGCNPEPKKKKKSTLIFTNSIKNTSNQYNNNLKKSELKLERQKKFMQLVSLH